MNFSTLKRTTMPSLSPNKSMTHYHVRSISLQARSHPSTLRIEEELNKLTTWKSSSSSSMAEAICTGIAGLRKVYICIEELLALPLTQQALTRQKHEKWVIKLLEESVRYIDICSNTRDTVLVMKEGLRQLQSSLRRRKVGIASGEVVVNDYIRSRKKMKKEISRSLAELKPHDNKFEACSSTIPDSDHHLFAVVRVLREASLITMSIFESLLLFLSAPVGKPWPTRWSLVSKLVQRGAAVGGGGGNLNNNLNEVEEVEIELGKLMFYYCSSHKDDSGAERIQSVQGRLEGLNASIEGLESGLECLFRRLIRARVSLLNILSH